MKWPPKNLASILAAAVIALGALAFWVWPRSGGLLPRVPGTDAAPSSQTHIANPVLMGKLVTGIRRPGNFPGVWPQFRGLRRDGRAEESGTLAHDWKVNPPRAVWSLEVGEGYSGVVIRAGRVYLLDYDRDTKQSALRCVSLADGTELWRFSYPLDIKRNHGMTRTVPTLAGEYLVALDSKCNVFCLDATYGTLKWSVSLVREFGAAIPEWYAGQCPLVDGDKVILAPGGKNALLLALDLATGKPIWQSPNPHDWKMTHASIMPMDFAGQHSYVYCASKGVVGIAAADGRQLWETTDWKISIATVPSPIPLDDGRIFLTGGYNAGSLVLQIAGTNSQFTAATAFKLPASVFGATQHTPILKDRFLYGIRADGRFVCLALDGKVVWASGSDSNFGLGSYLMAGDLIYALNDSGQLSLIAVSPERYQLLGQFQALTGRESWAPMALADGRLLVRDLTRLVCLDVATK